jgi:hypothetical protein
MDLVWGSKFCGAGEWPVGKHRKKTRRSWRKLHIGIDPNKGEIVIAALTTNDVDDPCPIGHVLEQPDSGTGGLGHRGWRYDQDSVYRAVIDHDPDARIIVPPRLAQQAQSGRGRHRALRTDRRLRFRKSGRHTSEVASLFGVLNQMLELGGPISVHSP